MGGIGSGNRWRWGARETCEANKRIDIRYLRKTGLLKPGTHGTLSWTQRGEPSGWIEYRYRGATLELDYKARPAGGEWTRICEHVPVESVEQPFGGHRYYMRCLRCQRRCLVLYGGIYFRCRKCQNLTYSSQNEDTWGRIHSKSSRIRKRLGDNGGFDDPFPDKPKGMHWKTYERLRLEGERVEDRLACAMEDMMMKFAGKM